MKASAVQKVVQVVLGQAATPVGTLTYNRDGGREYTTFVYDTAWLAAPDRFEISPDLKLVEGHQFRKAPTKDDSIFHFAFADTEPDGWGCRVIARDHAKRRRTAQEAGVPAPRASLTEMDYLLGVDDVSRVGALRLVDAAGNFLRTVEDGDRSTPPLMELGHLISATRAVEMNKETEADLRYLRGRGTSLGGMRPKCTVLDEDGHLAIGKFPSVKDVRTGSNLLSEVGPLHFGVVGADDPLRTPTDRPPGDGAYLLAPVGLDPAEFGEAAQFTTLCLAPSPLTSLCSRGLTNGCRREYARAAGSSRT